MTSVTLSEVPAPARGERRWAVRVVAAVAVLVGVSGLLVLAARPTGAPSASGVVPSGLRIAARAPVGDVEVIVATDGLAPQAWVAYRGPKGWLSVELDRAPAGASAAWASTGGRDAIPALAAVWGRVTGVRIVDVVWSDGTTTEVTAELDGHYLAVRPGVASPVRVTLRAVGGRVLERLDLS